MPHTPICDKFAKKGNHLYIGNVNGLNIRNNYWGSKIEHLTNFTRKEKESTPLSQAVSISIRVDEFLTQVSIVDFVNSKAISVSQYWISSDNVWPDY